MPHWKQLLTSPLFLNMYMFELSIQIFCLEWDHGKEVHKITLVISEFLVYVMEILWSATIIMQDYSPSIWASIFYVLSNLLTVV